MNLFWHRRDRRLADNCGLAAAASRDDGPVVPVFVIDPIVTATLGERKRAFVDRALRTLREQYRDRGSDLVVRTGSAAEVLPSLSAAYDADHVVYNECYEPTRREQGRAVESALNVGSSSHVDSVLVDPTTLESRYPTYSQFHADWQRRPKPEPAAEPTAEDLASISDDEPISVTDTAIDLPEASTAAARDRLDAFCTSGITQYKDRRDDLEAAVAEPTDAVSRLSPHLAGGTIGIREVWAAVTDVFESVDGRERRNVEKYGSELSWREWNYLLLYEFPELASENYNDPPNEIAWRNDDAELAAWKRGETGYPLVDAGMRQLEREGYVHNRPRQVVASFLTKHLLIDWRIGAAHFRDRLVDHDPATNAGSWQWIASTGTDSVDVRIFDPVAQLAKYDDEGAFVREYVPELESVPADQLIEWPTLPADVRADLAPDYPDPIVDRNAAYGRAQRVFEAALGNGG